jgi:hypothetical protein
MRHSSIGTICRPCVKEVDSPAVSESGSNSGGARERQGRFAVALKPLTGFRHFPTHHCVTGSVRHVYVHNEFDLSEDLLLGIGSGVSFSYWRFKGQIPFMGGRGNVGRPSEEGLVKTAGRRTGVVAEWHTTTSPRKAERVLLEMLDSGQPVMIQCDMGFLPYFDFGDIDYHFGWHDICVCGYDAGTRSVLVADRDEELHPVSLEDLARARGSTYKPFPPKNKWYTFDFVGKREPSACDVRQAIADQARAMLQPPIRNIGVKGIRKAANMIPKWPQVLNPEELQQALFNAYLFISPQGGSGGGLFRLMFSRFLREAAGITSEPLLADAADRFLEIGDHWERLGEHFRELSEVADPTAGLQNCSTSLSLLADMEQEAWKHLLISARDTCAPDTGAG